MSRTLFNVFMTLEPLFVSCHAPYSPDLNAIEEVFAQMKHYLRENDVVLQSVQDGSPLIWEAFGQISRDDCLGYINHAGYI